MALCISSLTRTSQYLVPQRDLRHLPHIEHAVYSQYNQVQIVSVQCSQSSDDRLPGFPGRHTHEPARKELQLPWCFENAVQSGASHLERWQVVVTVQLNECLADRPADAFELVDRDISPRHHEHDAHHAWSLFDGNEGGIALRHFQLHYVLKSLIHMYTPCEKKKWPARAPTFRVPPI